MRLSDHKLLTPVYLKTDEDTPWPTDEKAFYMLTADGLFLCRNHPFFQSSVVADCWPTELAKHKAFIKLNYPKVPQRLLERVAGFFSIIARRYASEAALLLAWDRNTKTVLPIVPAQCGTVGENWHGEPFPIDVQYEIPDLPPNLMLIGDIHSHVYGPAYSSATDREDELHRPGIHIVLGRLHEEPPDTHVEVTADGVRFRVNHLDAVLAGYRRRREHEVPQEWIDKLTVKSWSSSTRSSDCESSGHAKEHSEEGCAPDALRSESQCSQPAQSCQTNGGNSTPATSKHPPSQDETPTNRRNHE